jgi:hypothetical protein
MPGADEFWGSAPEDFRIGFELRVDFQSDYGFPTFLHCRSPHS